MSEQKSLLEEAESLRAEFLKAQGDQWRKQQDERSAAKLKAADEYLSDLADNLVETIKEKIGKNQIVDGGEQYMNSPYEEKMMAIEFKSEALKALYNGPEIYALHRMPGFKKLNELCASPAVNMCLGEPASRCSESYYSGRTSQYFSDGVLRIYYQQPYAVSEYAYIGKPYPASVALYKKRGEELKEQARIAKRDAEIKAYENAKAAKSAARKARFNKILHRKPK